MPQKRVHMVIITMITTLLRLTVVKKVFRHLMPWPLRRRQPLSLLASKASFKINLGRLRLNHPSLGTLQAHDIEVHLCRAIETALARFIIQIRPDIQVNG
jgi:hypothetical protein